MSWEAVQWANKQRLPGPQEQLVLLTLANCADPEGVAFAWWKRREHWWTYLVEHTRLSRSSVFRHLNKIEELGLGKRRKIEASDGVVRFIMELDLTKTVEFPPDDGTESQSRGETQSHRETGSVSPCDCIEESPESLVGGGGFARAREASEADQIADEIATLVGVDSSKDAAWFIDGPATIVQRWLDAGYTRAHLIDGVKRGMATKRDGRPRSIKYFGPIWTRVRGEAEAPIPLPQAGEENATVRNGFVGPIDRGRDLRSTKERRYQQAWDTVSAALGVSHTNEPGDGDQAHPASTRRLPESGGT